jgi:hypothetical protein
MSRGSSSRDANSYTSAQILHERFSGFGQNTLVIHKIDWLCSKSRPNFSALHPFQIKGNSETATISGTKTRSAQIALVHSAHVGEKVANKSNNCAAEF